VLTAEDLPPELTGHSNEGFGLGDPVADALQKDEAFGLG
jgi:hypothetical protein